MERPDHTIAAQAEEALRKNKHYLDHLAGLQEIQDVYTTADIYNVSGVLVARKGIAVNRDTAAQLAKHKLIKPLENQVEIKDTLTILSLRNLFDALYERMPDLKTIHDSVAFHSEFNNCLSIARLSPALLQKLSVFFYRFPDTLDQHIFCAWLTTLLTREMGFPEQKMARMAAAALCRDIGLLHLDPMLLDSRTRYTPDQWRAMQCHTVISKMIAEELGTMSPDQLSAIEEHHERFDGRGYPRGWLGNRLSVESQILALADAVCSVRFKQFSSNGRTLRDTQAFVQMNAASFHPDVYCAILHIYRISRLPRAVTHDHENVLVMAQYIRQRAHFVHQAADILEQVILYLANLEEQQKAHIAMKTAVHVLQMIKRSGQMGPMLTQWLQHIGANAAQEEVAELVELELIQNELYWQLGQVGRSLEQYISELKFLTKDRRFQSLQELMSKVWSNLGGQVA